MTDEATIQGLLAALGVSPENAPLRKLLADAYRSLRRFDEAAEHLRQGLKYDPANRDLQLALAECFYEENKLGEALVVLESLLAAGDCAEASLLSARLHLRRNDLDTAARHYQTAVDADPDLADETLAEQLGVSADGGWHPDSDDDEDERMGMAADGQQFFSTDSPVEFEQPTTSFEDVGGMDKIKKDIRLKIIHPLTHPEVYAAYGKAIGGGILMYGPPGCGKTHLARATAGEVDAGFINVGIHDVLDMWMGNSEKHLHAIFERARSSSPCVLFFDEVDALGASRSDMRASSGRHLINQFLSELDGISRANEGLLILAATNAPWHLDSAFRRPGRFDRVIFVPPPDAEGRATILQILMTGKPAERVDFRYLARKSEGYSGADLTAVVDLAVEDKLKAAMQDGLPKPITTKDLLKGIKQTRPSTAEWFSTAKNYALFSNEGGADDDVLTYLKIKP